MAFERVYMVWDYWDGPRSGIADFLGTAHVFRSEWNATDDDYAQTFLLTPIDQETLTLAIEQWSIWRDWDRAFHRGEVSQSTHPAVQGSPRYSELDAAIKARLARGQRPSRRAVPLFRVRSEQASAPPGTIRELEVEWTNIED